MTPRHPRPQWPAAVLMTLWLAFQPSVLKAGDDLSLLMDSLQTAISQKGVYDEFKKQKIQSLKNSLRSSTLNLEQRYATCTGIYKEYEKFHLDSAITYNRMALRLAREIGDSRKIIETELRYSINFSMHGMFHEAEEILRRYSSATLPDEFLYDFYYAHLQYEDFYSYTSYFQNRRRIRAYRDSVVMYSKKTSLEYMYQSTRELSNEARQPVLLDLLSKVDKDTPMYAMITAGLASTYRDTDIEKCKALFMRSTIADVKNCIKENFSLYSLALILYSEGDLKNAYTFAQSAFDDALTAGIQFRVNQTSNFYSIVNESYQKYQQRNQQRITWGLYILVIISLGLVLAIVYILFQLRKITRIRADLAVTNRKLKQLNRDLGEANRHLNESNSLLNEANATKEQYIGQFFNICSGYIDKIGNFQRELHKTAMKGNMEEVIRKLKSTTLVEDEIEALYAHFDTIFLNLYPSFLEDINRLLRPEEQIQLKQDALLNKELRIYALLRLGITDSDKIASFLHCSISTIYNYRTRMRNKALDKDHFEEEVCKFGAQ